MKRATQYVLVLVLFFAAWVVALQQVPHYAHALPKPQAVMSIVKIVRAPGAKGSEPLHGGSGLLGCGTDHVRVRGRGAGLVAGWRTDALGLRVCSCRCTCSSRSDATR